MSSLRPSQMTFQSRTDGGPFIEFVLYDEEGIPTDVAEEAESCDVYFSDVTGDSDAQATADTWHRILSVDPDEVRIFPIHQRSDRADYGSPKYGSITEIIVASRQAHPYRVPANHQELEDVLSMLPDGFARDWQLGLGMLWEYRFIIDSIAQIDRIDTVVIHGGCGADDAKIVGHNYYLGIDRYRDLKRSIDRLSKRHQRETRLDKQLICYTSLAHAADPTRYPERPKKLPANVLTDLINLGKGRPTLSSSDQKSAVNLLKDNAQVIAKQKPMLLLELKADIERVTLAELIERYKALMSANANEGRWQKFLGENPFILDMAFAYPIKMICQRPYVGNMCVTGQGANYSDFLMAARSTGNVALIEIKHPGKDLLITPAYRNNTYGPSVELSGTVAQIINQRASLQRQILELSHSMKEAMNAHAVPAIVIIGRTPTDEDQQRSFEQYRNVLKDVSVVTFDELQQRLEDIHKALSPSNAVSTSQGPNPFTDDGDPF